MLIIIIGYLSSSRDVANPIKYLDEFICGPAFAALIQSSDSTNKGKGARQMFLLLAVQVFNVLQTTLFFFFYPTYGLLSGGLKYIFSGPMGKSERPKTTLEMLFHSTYS